MDIVKTINEHWDGKMLVLKVRRSSDGTRRTLCLYPSQKWDVWGYAPSGKCVMLRGDARGNDKYPYHADKASKGYGLSVPAYLANFELEAVANG